MVRIRFPPAESHANLGPSTPAGLGRLPLPPHGALMPSANFVFATRSARAVRAGSVAAPRDCRARPAWSRGHSLPDRSRDTSADTCEARPAPRRGSIDPHKSCFLRGTDQDRRPKCRLEASPIHPLLVQPPHKAFKYPRSIAAACLTGLTQTGGAGLLLWQTTLFVLVLKVTPGRGFLSGDMGEPGRDHWAVLCHGSHRAVGAPWLGRLVLLGRCGGHIGRRAYGRCLHRRRVDVLRHDPGD